MRMTKINKSIIFAMISVLLIFASLSCAEDPPMPGIPQTFWGNVKYTNGENVEDGSIVRAFVDNENYTTTVIDGTYGYYSSFHVEDADNDNAGKLISFYVNDVFTGQTVVFESGTINLNLTIEKDAGNGEDNNNGGDGSGPTSNLVNPVANIYAPSFGFVNQSILINASGSFDTDGQIVSYDWNFGDGSASGSGFEVIHIYESIGNYTISVLVKDNDNLADIYEFAIKIMIDSDGDNWGDNEEKDYDTDPENDTDFPSDFDDDHIPDSVDSDDDNDGLSDYFEELLGSDPMFSFDVLNISEHLEYGFLVDLDKNGIYTIYFDNSQNKSSQVEYETDSICLIDNNFDGIFDYKYNIVSNALVKYKISNSIIYFVGLFIIVFIIIVLYFVYKKKIGSRKK